MLSGGGSGRFPPRAEGLPPTSPTSSVSPSDRNVRAQNESLTVRVDNAESSGGRRDFGGREGSWRDRGGEFNRGRGGSGRGNFERGRRDFGRDYGRDSGRDGNRDFSRDFGRDSGRGSGRGGRFDGPRNERSYDNEYHPTEDPQEQRIPLRGKRPRGRKQHRPLSYTEGFTVVTITTGPGQNDVPEEQIEQEPNAQDSKQDIVATTPPQSKSNQKTNGELKHKQSNLEENEEAEDEWEDAEEEVVEFGDKTNEETEQIEEEEEMHHKNHHNSSAESLERFIQEHTLDVDMETGTVIKKDPKQREKELTPLKTELAAQQSLSPESLQMSSPDLFMKTPEGHEKVLDWSMDVQAEYGAILSPEARLARLSFTHEEAQKLNMSVSSSEPVDSPTKGKDNVESPEKLTRVENVVLESGVNTSKMDDKPKEKSLQEELEAVRPSLTETEKELESILAREAEVRNEVESNELRLSEDLLVKEENISQSMIDQQAADDEQETVSESVQGNEGKGEQETDTTRCVLEEKEEKQTVAEAEDLKEPISQSMNEQAADDDQETVSESVQENEGKREQETDTTRYVLEEKEEKQTVAEAEDLKEEPISQSMNEQVAEDKQETVSESAQENEEKGDQATDTTEEVSEEKDEKQTVAEVVQDTKEGREGEENAHENLEENENETVQEKLEESLGEKETIGATSTDEPSKDEPEPATVKEDDQTETQTQEEKSNVSITDFCTVCFVSK